MRLLQWNNAASMMLITLSTAVFQTKPSNARQLLASAEQRSCRTALAGLPGWMSQLLTALPEATAAWFAAIRPSKMLRRSCMKKTVAGWHQKDDHASQPVLLPHSGGGAESVLHVAGSMLHVSCRDVVFLR